MTIIRNGMGSLHVRIGGLGNRASTETRTGSDGEILVNVEEDCLLNNRPFLRADGGAGLENSC